MIAIDEKNRKSGYYYSDICFTACKLDGAIHGLVTSNSSHIWVSFCTSISLTILPKFL